MSTYRLIVALVLLAPVVAAAAEQDEADIRVCDETNVPDIAECVTYNTRSYEILIAREIARLKASYAPTATREDQLRWEREYEQVATKALDDSQKAWWQFREAKCLYEETKSWGGSIAHFEFLACLHDEAKARYEDLKDDK